MTRTGAASSRRAALGVALAPLLIAAACGGDHDVDLVGRWVPTEVPSERFEAGYDFEPMAIDFTADGRWSGSDGCEDIDGTYRVDGEEFTSPLTGSGAHVGCTGGTVPYMELLHRARTVEQDGSRIEFRDKAGRLVIVLERGSAS